MRNTIKTFIVSAQNKVSGQLAAVARPDAKEANAAVRQFLAAGYIHVQVIYV